MNLYRNENSDPKSNAQRNLCGRTHYVDDDALRWHKSRVVAARVTDGGLLFAITTTDALDMNNTKRGYRYVIFDVFGNTVSRPDLEHSFRTRDACDKAMWAVLNALNAEQITYEAIGQAEKQHADSMQRLRETISQLKSEGRLSVAA
jgi:hypothetical protein